ncbi:hypothetical protein RCH21_002410 [Arthrobacter sp. PL16]|uniref:O-antigen ligase family protein n=1 Tax=Arthrobacter sp. PL16 TaxID=3071720 RepID=UPI002DFC43E0|nr:hypothetical protein [Arthrobacter sp. PL16]
MHKQLILRSSGPRLSTTAGSGLGIQPRVANGLQKQSIPFSLRVLAVLLALIPPTSGTLRGLLLPGLKVSEVIIVLVAAILLLNWGGKWKVADGVGLALLFFAFTSVVLTLVNYIDRPGLTNDAPIAMELASIPQFFLLYLVAFAFGQQNISPLIVLKWNLIFAAAVSIIALAQLFDVGSVRAVLATLTGNQEILNPLAWKTYRASGTFVSWHALGMYLAVTLAFSIVALFKGFLNRSERNKTLALSIIVLCGLLSALTATPILLAGVLLVFYSLRSKGILYTPAFILISLAVVLATPLGSLFSERLDAQFSHSGEGIDWLPQTISYRLMVWRNDYLPIIEENLLSGYGPLGSSDSGIFRYTESMYITLLMAGGVPLLLAYCCFTLVAFFKLRSISKIEGESREASSIREISRVLVLVILFLAGAQFLHPYLIDAGGSQLIYLALGLTLGAWHRQHRYVTPGTKSPSSVAIGRRDGEDNLLV